MKHSEDSKKIIWKNPIPLSEGVETFTVIYRDQSGGYQCFEDMVPESPATMAAGDPVKLAYLREAWNDYFRLMFRREWGGV